MQIFAHRGAAGRNADENSLEAIQRAVALGVDGIEVDVRRTRDDEAVLVHDQDLRRIAGDTRLVDQLSLDEIKEITLRHGTHVLTLDELTANVPSPMELDLEVKDVEAMDLLIRKLRTSSGLRERAIITSFSQAVIERVAHDLSDVRTALLMRTWPRRFEMFTQWAIEHHLYGIGFLSRQWSPLRMEQTHAIGLKVFAWEHLGIRSTRTRANKMKEMGADVVIVNQPGVYLADRPPEPSAAA